MIDSTLNHTRPMLRPEHWAVNFHSQSETLTKSGEHAAHVVADALVVENTLNAANSAHGELLVPQLAGGKVHHILLGNLANGTFNILGAKTTAGSDDLATNVLGDSSSAVKGEQNGSLELGFGALNLGGGNTVAETRPLAKSEVNQVIELSQILRDKIDTPETID